MSRLGAFEENTIVVGDVIEVLSQLPDACVDAIVTDPPYGLEFMGKEWDRFGLMTKRDPRTDSSIGRKNDPYIGAQINKYMAGFAYQSWTTAWANEAYRILKPGAYMLVMGGTRTHHRLGCGLEDAGFLILDELAWIYASGFPKSHDVSKGIDKRAGAEREAMGYSRGVSVEDNQGFGGIARGGVGIVQKACDIPVTLPATPEAQYWEGYGTALKPAHEPIWLCKKPNEGSYVDNVLKHGCGAMNIDGCRIGYEAISTHHFEGKHDSDRGRGIMDYHNHEGRWPANVIVDCYPEEFIGGVVIEGEGNIAWKGDQDMTQQDWQGHEQRKGGWNPQTGYSKGEMDKGNGLLGPYTRFFVIPKPSRAEKHKGCEEFYWDKTSGKPVRCSKERWEELGREEEHIKEETGKRVSLRAWGNIHVTVKPVRLGKWLIKLIVPHQHPVVVLDPFCGSGTFLMAAQELNYEDYQIGFYGVDKDGDSVKTTIERLEKDRAARQMELL